MPLRPLPGQEVVRRSNQRAMRQRRPANCLHLLSCWTCPLGRRTERLGQAHLQGGYLGQAHLQVGYLGQAHRGPEPVARVAAPAGPLADCPLAGRPAEGAQSHLDGIR